MLQTLIVHRPSGRPGQGGKEEGFFEWSLTRLGTRTGKSVETLFDTRPDGRGGVWRSPAVTTVYHITPTGPTPRRTRLG